MGATWRLSLKTDLVQHCLWFEVQLQVMKIYSKLESGTHLQKGSSIYASEVWVFFNHVQLKLAHDDIFM